MQHSVVTAHAVSRMDVREAVVDAHPCPVAGVDVRLLRPGRRYNDLTGWEECETPKPPPGLLRDAASGDFTPRRDIKQWSLEAAVR